jgi:hypothetical protein
MVALDYARGNLHYEQRLAVLQEWFNSYNIMTYPFRSGFPRGETHINSRAKDSFEADFIETFVALYTRKPIGYSAPRAKARYLCLFMHEMGLMMNHKCISIW